MRKKFVVIGLAALLLMAVVPTMVLAASKQKAFSASGALVQTGAGDTTQPVLAGDAAAAAPAMAQGFFAGLFATTPIGPSTPGATRLDQAFKGRLSQSTFGALRKSRVSVNQNSWLTVDPSSGAAAGVAWGSFDLVKGRANTLTGTYAASIAGFVVPDSAVGATCASGLFVNVTDVGIWEVDEESLAGSFQELSSTGLLGGLAVQASGCLGEEQASFSVAGVRGADHGMPADVGPSSDDEGGKSNGKRKDR